MCASLIRSGATALLLATVIVTVGACGWHLRGMDTRAEKSAQSTPTEGASNSATSSMKLILNKRNNPLTTAIQRIAWENNYQFSDDSSDYLVIESEKLEKRPLSVTETGIAAQYQLVLTITFSHRNAKGNLLLEPQQIVSWRNYDFDAQLIIAKSQEEEALISEMREELAQRIISTLK